MVIKNIFSKIRLKSVIKVLLFFSVLICVLWYKAPMGGLHINQNEVKEIMVYRNDNEKKLYITGENEIKYIVYFLNSAYLVRDIPFLKKPWNGFKIIIYNKNKEEIKGINNFEIYSSAVMRIGRFNYVDQSESIPFDYINSIYTNDN